MKISKISFGTAQLGMNYGIRNEIGKPDFESSIQMLKYAWRNGINSFDTSPLYGDSEKIIGSFISSDLKNLKNKCILISKLPKIENLPDYSFDNLYKLIKKQLKHSLENLHIETLPIYLVHHPLDINFNNGIVIECLNELKSEGLIEKIGISVYNPKEAEKALKFKEINVIQLPINLFDHRFYKSNLLKKLKKREFIIFARSIYLQGLFFLNPVNLPKNLEIAKEPMIKLINLNKNHYSTIAKLAFLFVRRIPEVDSMVIGVEKLEQITNNLKILKERPISKYLFDEIIESFSNLPEKLINPSIWNE